MRHPIFATTKRIKMNPFSKENQPDRIEIIVIFIIASLIMGMIIFL